MINEQIRDKEVRLIGENGEQLGVMSARDALKLQSPHVSPSYSPYNPAAPSPKAHWPASHFQGPYTAETD